LWNPDQFENMGRSNMSVLRDLVVRNRSYRRFEESHEVTRETLLDLIGLARWVASAGNRQPLRYILAVERQTNAHIFPCLSWAGYLEDWQGPASGERPAAYILILSDQSIPEDYWCDAGIAAQTILLGATERGLGGCIIGTFRQQKLQREFAIPDQMRICLVLALGKPAETVVLEDVRPGRGIRYWRDEKGTHHVPKRTLGELILPV